MQYLVTSIAAGAAAQSIGELLCMLDPAALVDVDTLGRLRVSTSLVEDDIVTVLARAGIAVPHASVHRLASECCGGCGG